ncbi:hypothetical protein Y1Q_0017949 [Alligator mississippiensis]|uniref:Uncharacterized protein n=1 Tax=Alligator mississippiensis TaxID=8496 RepID=A0A151MXL4_ALLMI|nr:hypothetical protein Y1Q_0017949 [Alligator mississippiensis]
MDLLVLWRDVEVQQQFSQNQLLDMGEYDLPPSEMGPKSHCPHLAGVLCMCLLHQHRSQDQMALLEQLAAVFDDWLKESWA